MSKLEDLHSRAKYAHLLTKTLAKVVQGQMIVAGGLVRDIWALEQGIDLQGSGDIDLLLINNTDEDLSNLALKVWEAILDNADVSSCKITDVTYSYEKSEQYPDADDRLYGVMQFKVVRRDEELDIDILVYETEFNTLEEVLDTFNCNINKFWLDEAGNTKTQFDPSHPFYYREGDREKNEERYEKCVMRYNLVAKAAHPYQRIDEESQMCSNPFQL